MSAHPGAQIVAARRKWGMTQRSLAERMGYSPKHVCQVEKGVVPVSVWFATIAELVLQIPAENLLQAQAEYDLALAREMGSE